MRNFLQLCRSFVPVGLSVGLAAVLTGGYQRWRDVGDVFEVDYILHAIAVLTMCTVALTLFIPLVVLVCGLGREKKGLRWYASLSPDEAKSFHRRSSD